MSDTEPHACPPNGCVQWQFLIRRIRYANVPIPSTRVFEDDKTVAFMDINPVTDGHLLIVPRTHAGTIFDISASDLAAVAATAKRVADAIPRWTGECRGFDWKVVTGDPERIGETADRIRTHMPAEWA